MPKYNSFWGVTGIASFGVIIAVVCFGCWGTITGFLSTKRVIPTYPLSVAVVNLNRVKNEAQAFQKFTEFIEGRYSEFHKEILVLETKFRKEHEEFQERENRGETPTPEMAKRKEDFDKRVAEMDYIIQQRKKELNEKFSQITIQIKEKIKKIINRLGRERKLNLILNATVDPTLLDATVVLYGGNEIDMTDEVIHYLDEELPTIQIPGTTEHSEIGR